MRNGLSESEAGKLGAIATKKIREIRKLKAIQIYDENPCKCQYCGNNIPFEKRFNKTCSRSCAASISNINRGPMKDETKEKISNSLKIYNNSNFISKEKKIIKKKKFQVSNPKIKYCASCGAEKGKCEHPEICKKYRLFKTLSIFGFDLNSIGTNKIFSEYEKTKKIIEDFYIKNGTSDSLLKETFNYSSGAANFHKILKSLDIKSRNHSDAQEFAIEHNRRDNIPNGIHYCYNDEYHTTWDNREVYLRSSYETDFANILDNKKIYYEVEALKIKYFDTITNKFRMAIPDFYIKDENLIVEIKSQFTLNVQNMKDKVKAYKGLGYKFKLILEHQEVDLNIL